MYLYVGNCPTFFDRIKSVIILVAFGALRPSQHIFNHVETIYFYVFLHNFTSKMGQIHKFYVLLVATSFPSAVMSILLMKVLCPCRRLTNWLPGLDNR